MLGVDDRVAVLAPPTGLPHEPALDALHALADGLAVSDLRAADVRINPELAQQPVDDDLQVQLAHAGDDGLSRLLVAANGERRVLFGEPLERHGELLLVGLRLGLDGLPDNGLGEDHLLQHDLLRVVRRDQRVTRSPYRRGRWPRRARPHRPHRAARGCWRAAARAARCARACPWWCSSRRSRP